MAKPYGKPVAHCQKCRVEVGEEHPYSWCTECGEPLSREVLLQVPRQAAALAVSDAARDADAAVIASPQRASSEGSVASAIGDAIMVLSFIGAAICVFSFGRIEVPSGMYSTETQWSPLLVSVYIAGGLNGMFFGYLLSKVGSVLRRLEKMQENV